MPRIALESDLVVLTLGAKSRTYVFAGDRRVTVAGRRAVLEGEGGLTPVTPSTRVARLGGVPYFKVGQVVRAPDGATGTIQATGAVPVAVDWA